MSPMIRRTFIILALVTVVVAAFWWLGRPKPIVITVKEIDQGKVELTIANTRAGTIEACQRAKLSTILGGRIEALPIKEGDRVKKGQLLMKLWNDDQQAQSTLALTQVATARQHANDLCAQAANAEREANRQTALREKGFISTSREDSARTDAQARRAACDAAKADVIQFQAKVSATRVEQGRTILYAPFDGTVAKIVGEVGEYSTPSPPGIQMPPAVDLIDDSCLYVKAPMDEVDAPKIKAGQPVRISLDALPKKSFPGKVRRVAPFVSAVEKQARTVDIEADFNTPDEPGKLLVGYSADIEVILAVRDNVVRVPTSALLEGSRVLVAGSNSQLEERKIKTGLSNWEFTEVLEGLNAGERVVTSLERAGVKAGAHYTLEDKPQGK
ncbi:MAG: efflux RND transporter periplasmic adaptor subunit [Betaproteobacteria bacterium]